MISRRVESMKGFGDNVFQRAILRELTGDVYLDTPWPEVYEDLPNIHPVRPTSKLRTQAKNTQRWTRWETHPEKGCHQTIKLGYGDAALRGGGIVETLARAAGVTPSKWNLPATPRLVEEPYVVVRPVTERKEWLNSARNPLPIYIAQAAQRLKDAGFRVFSVADLEDGQEWALDPLPPATDVYHEGEIETPELLSMIEHADAVVGGVGWLLPVAICYRTPLLCILGGNGAHNRPETITHPSMDLGRVWWATPDNFCQCADMRHACDKTISDFGARLDHFVREAGLCAVS